MIQLAANVVWNLPTRISLLLAKLCTCSSLMIYTRLSIACPILPWVTLLTGNSLQTFATLLSHIEDYRQNMVGVTGDLWTSRPMINVSPCFTQSYVCHLPPPPPTHTHTPPRWALSQWGCCRPWRFLGRRELKRQWTRRNATTRLQKSTMMLCKSTWALAQRRRIYLRYVTDMLVKSEDTM